jgi:hypothetical protein
MRNGPDCDYDNGIYPWLCVTQILLRSLYCLSFYLRLRITPFVSTNSRPLYCLSFDIRLLIIPLVSSNSRPLSRYSLAVNQLMVVTTNDWENWTQQKTSGELMYSSIMYNRFRWCLCSYKRLLPLYTCSISLFGTLIFLVCHQSLSTTLIEQFYWWSKLVYLMNTRIPIFGWQASLISISVARRALMKLWYFRVFYNLLYFSASVG